MSDEQSPQGIDRPNIFTRLGRRADRMLLRSVPEYHLFESEPARLKAIKELDADLSASRGFFRAMMFIWISAIVAANLSLCVVPMLAPPPLNKYGMFTAIAIGPIAITCVVWVWRRGVSRRLRGKLIDCGVPVCRECGYALRGLAASPENEPIRCPECGWSADDAVRTLISSP